MADSRRLGQAQRRRIGAPSNVYDAVVFDGGGSGSESEATFKGTMAMHDNPALAAQEALDRLGRVKAQVNK